MAFASICTFPKQQRCDLRRVHSALPRQTVAWAVHVLSHGLCSQETTKLIDLACVCRSAVGVPAQHTLLLHCLAAMEALLQAAGGPDPAGTTNKQVAVDPTLLKSVQQCCMRCLHVACVGSQLRKHQAASGPNQGGNESMLHSSPLADATSALLGKVQQHATPALALQLFDNVKALLNAEELHAQCAGAIALLHSLEARRKPQLPGRTVPDVLNQLVHKLADAASALESVGAYLDRHQCSEATDTQLQLDASVLLLRCVESIIAQVAAFRQLGPAAPSLLPVLARLLVAVRFAVVSGALGPCGHQGALLVIMGCCAVLSSVVRNRAESIKGAWPIVAAVTTGALVALQAVRSGWGAAVTDRCDLPLHNVS